MPHRSGGWAFRSNGSAKRLTGSEMAAKERVSFVICAGEYDRIHAALVTAAAAAAVDVPVTLFFTMQAVRALARGEGWRALAAGADGVRPAERDALYRARGVADFETLLASCVELGAEMQVCETGLRALDLSPADLRPELRCAVVGAVTMLAGGDRGRIVFV